MNTPSLGQVPVEVVAQILLSRDHSLQSSLLLIWVGLTAKYLRSALLTKPEASMTAFWKQLYITKYQGNFFDFIAESSDEVLSAEHYFNAVHRMTMATVNLHRVRDNGQCYYYIY